MLENSLKTFSDHVFLFICGNTKNSKGLLVKKHTEKLNVMGDFSFPSTVKSWHGVLDLEEISDGTKDNLMELIGKTSQDLVAESINWNLSVQKVLQERGRVHLFLLRPKAIEVGLSEALRNIKTISWSMQSSTCLVALNSSSVDPNCITSLRLRYIYNSVRNLFAISEIDNAMKVVVTAKCTSITSVLSLHFDHCFVLCGTVLNAKSGVKETKITGDDFIRLRQNEMMLIAQHKYGVRVSTDSKWKEFISHLGESAVIFELLQAKPSSPVKINFDCSSAGSSKGAAFILYNCARLETIIRTYNEKVEQGIYPKLPSFEDTDFSLLTQEEEWTLIFNFILGLPSLLTNCVVVVIPLCEFRPHLICGFLCSMVRTFSQYYRKVRILTEPRSHLLPVLFARMHMLKILNDTLKICLKILNIRSVSQM